MNASQISNYIISLTQNNPEEDLTNLKLQKILYYLQGFHLAIYNEELFVNEIEPWKYGPVVSDVYHTFKAYGNDSIIVPETEMNFDFINESQKMFINKVYFYFRQFSAIKLMELTHSELPWISTFGKERFIPKELIKNFFLKNGLLDNFKVIDVKLEREKAAQALLADYLYDSNLTDLTTSDFDDIHEY